MAKLIRSSWIDTGDEKYLEQTFSGLTVLLEKKWR